MTRRVTMADIAKRAGVHSTTVSLALRNHPSLPTATKQRLRALADEMGYWPDPAMRALVAYREQARRPKGFSRLAYLTNWDCRWGWQQAPAHGEFHQGATARARQLGYEFDHFWLGEPGMSHERMSDILVNRGITGVLVASYVEENDHPLRLDWKKFCGVKIDFLPFATELNAVTNDQRLIIQLAVQRALAAGYRRIGLVIPSWWDRAVRLAWSAGFLAMQQQMSPANRIPILGYPEKCEVDFSRRSVHATVSSGRVAHWLDTYQPDVLISHLPFVQNDLEALGISIPRDVAYVDIFLQNEMSPKYAGVRQNCQRVGEVAVELLDAQLQQNSYGLPIMPVTTMVEGTWRDGTSLPANIIERATATGGG